MRPTPGRRSFSLHALAIAAALVFAVGACSSDSDDDGSDEPIDSGEDDGDGEFSTFVDLEPAAPGATRIAIIGDAGERNDDTQAVAAIVAASGAGAVFTVGDNEYTTEGRTVESYQESVGEVYAAWVASSTFFPIPGDHDYGDQCDDDDADADLDAYVEFFDLPSGPEDETYYDVLIGDLHVFAIDSLIDCHRDGGAKLARQEAWLAEMVPASQAALQVVLLHNPPYSSGTSHGSFEELRWDFADWGVDLVVAGDDHIYERSEHDGVVYLVNGLGGIEAHELGDPIEGSEILYGDQFGATILTTDADGADVVFMSVDGEIIDQFRVDA